MEADSTRPKHLAIELTLTDEWIKKAVLALNKGSPTLALEALARARDHQAIAKAHLGILFPDVAEAE